MCRQEQGSRITKDTIIIGRTSQPIIFVESIKVADANSLDLTLNQKISVIGEEGANKGYIRMISTSGAHDTYVKGVHLGSRNAASIGDVEVQGLQTYYTPAAGVYTKGAVITISGH